MMASIRTLLPTVLLAYTSAVCAAPAIFNITRTADSGDVIGIQGADFGTSPSVTVSDGTNTGQMTLANGGILNKDDQGTLLSAKLPPGLSPGKIYTVTVTSGASSSTPKQINVPQIGGYLDLAGLQVTPSRTFRIYGDNLFMPGLSTSVFLNQGASSYPCTLENYPEGGRFIIKVTTPSNLPTSGTFTVFVRAGGVTTGFGVAGEQTLSGRTNGNDVWGLGVPWGADYAPFHNNIYNVKNPPYNATGNGTTSDAAAIQSAINAANTGGGGTVYLPAGTYNVGTSTLSVKSNVVLKGDGMDGINRTTIKANSSSAAIRPVSMDGNLVGLVDLRVLVEPGVGPESLPGRECAYSTARTKLFALRCNFDQKKPAATNNVEAYAIRWDNANQMVIKGCVTNIDARRHKFGNVVLQNGRDILFTNNNLTYRTSRTWLDFSLRVQAERNTINICNDRIVAQDNSGGFRYTRTKNAVFLNNTIQKKDVLGNDAPIPYFSDGEAIMTELCPVTSFGTATGAGSSTLIDTAKTWGNMTGHWVMITHGAGAGQLRKIASNTSTSLTISGTWDVLPTTSSNYSIFLQSVDDSLVKDNTMIETPFGVVYSGCNIVRATVVGNTMTSTGGMYLTGFQCDNNGFHGTNRNVAKDIVIENNLIVDNDKQYGSHMLFENNIQNGIASTGDMFWGATIYGNAIDAFELGDNSTWRGTGEGYIIKTVNGAANKGIPGPLLDKNEATDSNTAFRANLGNRNVTIWDSVLNNCGKSWDKDGIAPINLRFGPSNSSNLALGQPVTTSADVASSLPGMLAVDGDPATFWQANSDAPQSIRVDLGASRSVNRVKLNFGTFFATEYTIQVSPDGLTNWTTIKEVTVGTSGISDFTGLTGTGRYLKVNITRYATFNAKLYELEVYSVGLAAPWQNQDIGAVGAPGSANASGGTFTVSGAGLGVGGSADRFHYVYQQATGDCSITARIISQSGSSDQSGVMIRESLATDSKYAMLYATASGGFFGWRADNGSGIVAAGAFTLPEYLRVTRVGALITAYRSEDGVTWTQIGVPQPIAAATVYIGLAQSSRVSSVVQSAIFENVNAMQ